MNRNQDKKSGKKEKENGSKHESLRCLRQEIALDGKHLACGSRHKAVDLARILLHLPAVEHALQPAGLLRQLEEALPLVLGQRRLLESRAADVLRLALRLPGGDFLLLASQSTLVVLEIVVLGMVRLDGVQEQVAVFLEERVDAQ